MLGRFHCKSGNMASGFPFSEDYMRLGAFVVMGYGGLVKGKG